MDEKIGWLDAAAAAAEREQGPERSIVVRVLVATGDGDGASALAGALNCSVEEAAESPHGLVGAVEHMVDTLRRRRDRWGISYVTVVEGAEEDFAPVVEQLAGT